MHALCSAAATDRHPHTVTRPVQGDSGRPRGPWWILRRHCELGLLEGRPRRIARLGLAPAARAAALIALALIVPLLIVSCGREASSDGVLRFGLANPPRMLDPRFATDAASERINRLLYRRLVEFDEQSLPIPGIATWEQVSPTAYRFLLGEEGRLFSDGSRLTAADVAATYRSLLDPDLGSPHRATLALIERIETRGEDEIEFELKTADTLFPAYLGIGILPAALAERGDPSLVQPVGSGTFRLLDWPEPARLRLQRRDDGLLVDFVAVKDPSVRVMKLLRGEIQMLQSDLSPELVDYLAQRDRVRVETRAGTNLSYLGFNLQDPALGSLQVRRAIAHAIDREALVRHLLRGRAQRAETLLPADHWAGVTGLEPLAYDPQRARALLAAEGWGPENPLRLTYKTSANPFSIRLATAVQAQLAPVGILVDVRSYDWGTFFGDIKEGRFQVYSLTWVGIRTPDIFRYAFHSESFPPAGANRGRLQHEEVDRLIETARAEPDLARQSVHYQALQRLLHETLVYVPLWYDAHVLVHLDGVHGYRLALDGNYDALAEVRYAPGDGSDAF